MFLDVKNDFLKIKKYIIFMYFLNKKYFKKQLLLYLKKTYYIFKLYQHLAI
jgi:hypothetical protein